MSLFITAVHPARGTLWAATDEAAHHLRVEVAERCFSALLKPFRSRQGVRWRARNPATLRPIRQGSAAWVSLAELSV
jgi:hypothetical protein